MGPRESMGRLGASASPMRSCARDGKGNGTGNEAMNSPAPTERVAVLRD